MEVASTARKVKPEESSRSSALIMRIQSAAPSLTDCVVSIVSAALLVLSFPDFDLWPLAWVALVPLLFSLARAALPVSSFLLGWLWGTVFFYGSCYWLTYSMIHFGGIPGWLAFVLLIPGALVLGLFPALFALLVARSIRKWGTSALFLAPLFWSALELGRLEITGQLWNAIGYSQAYQPALIRIASWGGVYAVGFLIVSINAAIAFALLVRSRRAILLAVTTVLLVSVLIFATYKASPSTSAGGVAEAVVVAIQPNVPMDLVKSSGHMRELSARHFEMSEASLRNLSNDGKPRLVIWPESPMNFTYGTDSRFRDQLATFAKLHNTSVLINSLEVAPGDGLYNSAMLINQEGSPVAQYDKIRLLPFGEYVPLPQWLPGAGLIRGIVGDFTPGTDYRLMHVGPVRTGVFICIESAYPSIARRFTGEGADVLINISNDGYLGPTAVMRQHLANAVFRAVENGRPLLRVTNTGITAFITSTGEVKDATPGFQTAVRTWGVARTTSPPTFYAAHGDLFAGVCVLLSITAFVFSFKRRVGGGRRKRVTPLTK